MQNVLVTGASTGVGLALAKQIVARKKYHVILTARESSLSRFDSSGIEESENVVIRPLDIRSHEDRHKIIDEIKRRWGGVDILINNAGISYRSVLEHMETEDEQLQLETNYLGPIELVKLALPSMREKKRGHIINISSVGGMMAMPTMGSYSASKFALEGATEALWYEMKPWNIAVTLIEPGFINSNSFHNVYWSKKAKSAYESDQAYSCYYRHMTSFVERLMRWAIATPESIAKRTLKVMESTHPPLRLQATIDARFFAVLRRILPRRFYHWLLYVNLPGIRTWKTNA